MTEPRLRPFVVDPLKVLRAEAFGAGVIRLAKVVGAVVMLLRLALSERARGQLRSAARELESTVNEVNARIARRAAEEHGARVPLRVVSPVFRAGRCDLREGPVARED